MCCRSLLSGNQLLVFAYSSPHSGGGGGSVSGGGGGGGGDVGGGGGGYPRLLIKNVSVLEIAAVVVMAS